MTADQARKLSQHPLVRDVEGEGCDDGFYFVHLKSGHDFDIDPWFYRTSANFTRYTDAVRALKKVTSLVPGRKSF